MSIKVEVIDYLIKDSEFIIHLGVHKTATTYIQNILNQNKYDLALQGIIVVDFEIFRELIDNGNIEKTNENIYSILLERLTSIIC